MPAPDRVFLGKSGEDAASVELERRGYEIVARRYRTRIGEIDIIARDGQTLVFVEVKARRTATCGHPAEAVTLHKQAKVTAMAVDYMARERVCDDQPCRFDVAAVHLGEQGEVLLVELFQNAFDAVGWH
jgi:putative endonuclease